MERRRPVKLIEHEDLLCLTPHQHLARYSDCPKRFHPEELRETHNGSRNKQSEIMQPNAKSYIYAQRTQVTLKRWRSFPSMQWHEKEIGIMTETQVILDSQTEAVS